MKCRRCEPWLDIAVEFVWNHENPPGYVCPSCGNTMSACALCEQPCSGEFCGALCEGQFYDEHEPEEDDSHVDDGFDEPATEEDRDGR